MHSDPPKSRSYFGIKEEFIALAIIAPLIFACMVTDPILVSVDNFNNGQPTVTMTYAAQENQTFDINISKYVARGNWSYDGVFPNFTIQMCPTAGTPSNLRLYFPEGNGSTLLHAGALGGCQNVTVNMSSFDTYFNATSGTLINLPYLVGVATGSGVVDGVSMMMLRNPKVYDVNEEVAYTLLWPYLESDAVRYTCFEGDAVRSVTTPAKYWNLTFPLPGGLPALPPMPIPLPISNTSLNAVATIWDMQCPSYGVAGKYMADVTGVRIYLDNVLWPDFFNTTDDFNNSAFNTTIWDVRTVNASMPPINHSVLRMESPLVGTGVNAYYSPTVNPNATQRFNITINISDMDLNGQMFADLSGLIALFNGTSNPTTQAAIVNNVTNMLAFNDSVAQVLCNPATLGANTALGPGAHTFTVSSEGNNISFFVDGIFLDNCSGANGINQSVYYMFSPDALTDLWIGNMSVDSVNITFENWDGGAWIPYLQYYDNFTSLNATAWTILNNTVIGGSNYSIQSWMVNPSGFAYYVNNWTESKVDLYSYAADNGSGIVVYYDEPVANVDSSTTMFMINISANASDMEGDLAGVFLSRSKMSPDTSANFLSQVGGAIFYNSTHYQMFCDMSSSTQPNVTEAFTVNNDSMLIFYDNTTLTYVAGTSTLDNCSLPNSDFYFGFTSDPLTDAMNGNSSVGNISIAALNVHNVTGWRW